MIKKLKGSNFIFLFKILSTFVLFSIILSINSFSNQKYETSSKDFLSKIKTFIIELKNNIKNILLSEQNNRYLKYENQVLFAKLYFETQLENILIYLINKIENKDFNDSLTTISISPNINFEEIKANYIPSKLYKYKDYYFTFFFRDNFSTLYLYLSNPSKNILKTFLIKNLNFEIFKDNNILITETLIKKFFFISIFANLNFFDKEIFLIILAPKLTLLDFVLIISTLLLIIFLIIIIQTYYSIILERKNNFLKEENKDKLKIEKSNFLNNNYIKEEVIKEKELNNKKLKVKETHKENIVNSSSENFDFDKEYKDIEKEILNL